MKAMGAALLVTFLCAPVYATEVTQTKSVPVQADNLFTKADKDQDGKLDQKEFAAFKQLQEERMIRQIKQNSGSIRKIKYVCFIQICLNTTNNLPCFGRFFKECQIIQTWLNYRLSVKHF